MEHDWGAADWSVHCLMHRLSYGAVFSRVSYDSQAELDGASVSEDVDIALRFADAVNEEFMRGSWGILGEWDGS